MGLSIERKTGLLILIVFGVAAVLAGPGIWAYFSSTATSGANLFQTGAIELKVDDQNPWTGTFTAALTDLMPGKKGWGNVTLSNSGTNPFDVWVKITGVTTAAGTETAPEGLETAATDIDSVMRYGLNVGGVSKIADSANFFISTPAHGLTGTGVKDSWIYLGTMSPAGTLVVRQSFLMDSATTNWAQGDQMTFNVVFYAQQSEGDTRPTAPTPELTGYARP